MINPQLLDYVKSQIAQGANKDTIKQSLLSAGGWNGSDIDEAFRILTSSPNTNMQNPVGSIPSAPVKCAGFWIRWVAFSVDALILIIPVTIVQLIIGVIFVSAGFSGSARLISEIIYTLVVWIYFATMTYYKSATLGKMLVGIQVKSETGGKLSSGKVVLRETIGKLLSTILIFIGYIMVAFTKNKQGLHDKIAKSIVVYKDPSKSHQTGIIIGVIIAAFLPALAVLGILSSVVLVSLNTARQKGFDAQTESILSQMRVEAEVYYGNNNSYSTAKNCATGMFSDPSLSTITSGLKSGTVLTCYADGSSYAISAPLSTTGQNFCVDSSAFNGNGIAVNNGSKASCQQNSNQVSSSNTNQPVVNQVQQNTSQIFSVGGNSSYTYTLPSGWTSAQNNGQGVQASNQSLASVLTITTNPIPASAGNVTSISQVMTTDDMNKLIQSEFLNVTINSVTSGSIGGENAIVAKFNGVLTENVSGTQKQSKPLFVVQYATLHNGTLYMIMFMADASKQTTSASDFQTMINSFTFK